MIGDSKGNLELFAEGKFRFRVEASDKPLHVLPEDESGLDVERTYLAPPFVQCYSIDTGRFGALRSYQSY